MAKNAFRGPRNIDEMLGDICNGAERVRVCAECLTDQLLMDSNKTLKESYVKTTEIHEFTHDIHKKV